MSVRSYDILIVDDDKTSRSVLEHRLRRLSFTNIHTACNGMEALKSIVAKHYDLIFLDNNMPTMSGLEFLRRCRDVSILDSTLVIMLTGMADGDTLRSVKEEGLKVDDFIVKPLETDVLKAKLDRLGATTAPWSAASRNADTGTFLSISLDSTSTVTKLRMFGSFLQDDKHAVKDVPDQVSSVSNEAIIIDMKDVLTIDEFGIGMLLLINGVACMASKITYLLLDGRTIKQRLMTLGIDKIMRVIDNESEALIGGHAVAEA